MSQENVEMARQYSETFNAGGLDAVEQFWHPEIEVFDPPTFPDAGRYVGRDAVHVLVESYLELGWDGVFHDPEFLDAGDEVLFVWQMRGKSAHGGGLPLESAFAHLIAFDDGQVRRIRQFLTREEALEAAGLSE